MIKFILESQEYSVVNGEQITYILKRSRKRKRSISMRYNRQNQLQINVPYKMPQAIIDDFLRDKYSWVKSHQTKLKTRKSPKSFLYTNGELHDLMGHQYQLRLIPAKSSEVFLKQDELMVFHRKNSSIKNILDNWYKTQALDYLTKRTILLAEKYHFPKVRTIKVRNMRARWGSCSSLAEITYNTHLIKTSLQCIDYVIIHELCHLIHANHSARFYQLQTQINPHWKTQKKVLNSYEIST